MTVKPTDFAGPPPGPTKRSRVRKNASDPEVDPMTCFREYFTIEMEDLAYDQSIRYVKHLQVIDKPSYVHDKLPWPPKWTSEFLKEGHHTRESFNRFLSAVIGLAGHGQAGGGGGPQQWWSDDWNVNKPWLAELGSRDWFKTWKAALHLENPVEKTYWTGLRKAGKFVEMFRQRCMKAYNTRRDMSYDEATAETASRTCAYKHNQSRFKPCDGIRFYSACEAETGYLKNFVVDLRDKTTIEDMMFRVLEPYKALGYNVWADNLFVTVGSCKRAKDMGINLAGTCRSNSGFDMKLWDDKSVSKAGDWKCTAAEPGIFSTVWIDAVRCKFMSNHVPPEGGEVKRRKRGCANRLSLLAPIVAVLYNIFMGGVDRFDALRAAMTTRMKSNKWWHTLWHFVIDSALVNAYVYYLACNPSKPMSRAKFIRVISEDMRRVQKPASSVARAHVKENDGANKKRKRNRLQTSPGKVHYERRSGCDDLHPARFVERGFCKLCLSSCIDEDDKASKVNTGCSTCDTHLCVECMYDWHKLPVGVKLRKSV